MRLIRSAGQNVSPSDDGRLYDQIFEDGLFEDATITAAGTNNVSISALYGVISGRDFTAEAQTLAVTLPESDTATGYIYVEINLSADTIISMGSALSPFTPTYEDINDAGAVAQMIIAEYQASTTAVTSVTPTYSKTSVGGLAPGSVATVESSPSTHNYSVGDYLIYGGTLYKVTAAIAIGESLAEGTNITAAVLTDDLMSPVHIENVTFGSLTISGTSVLFDQTTDAPTVSGYSPKFIGGYTISGNNYANCSFARLYLNTSTKKVEWAIRNNGSSAATIAAGAKFVIVYIKD